VIFPPAAWPGKTLLVMWMRYCGQTKKEEMMQHFFFLLYLYTVNYYVVLFVDHYMCKFVLFVMYTV